jgi:hypothetical protein
VELRKLSVAVAAKPVVSYLPEEIIRKFTVGSTLGLRDLGIGKTRLDSTVSRINTKQEETYPARTPV